MYPELFINRLAKSGIFVIYCTRFLTAVWGSGFVVFVDVTVVCLILLDDSERWCRASQKVNL